jgi:MoxR-like ATPase
MEDIFGGLDIASFTKRNKQRYKIEGYAADVETLFIDEVFKASPIVLNSLLTLLNERTFRNGDDGVIQTPLMAVFGASNELPKSIDDNPFYDRLLLRYNVSYLHASKNLMKMIDANLEVAKPIKPILTKPEVLALQDLTRKVEIPEEVKAAIIGIRPRLKSVTDSQTSDRRFAKAALLIQAQALINGRKKATMHDLEILQYALWHKLHDYPKVKLLVQGMANVSMGDYLSWEDMAVEILETAKQSGDFEGARDKVKELYEKSKKFDSDAGKELHLKLSGILREIVSVINSRKSFVVTLLTKDNSLIYRLSKLSAAFWTKAQLRSAGFHWKNDGEYWYHYGPKKRTKSGIELHKERMCKEVKKQLGVIVTVNKI